MVKKKNEIFYINISKIFFYKLITIIKKKFSIIFFLEYKDYLIFFLDYKNYLIFFFFKNYLYCRIILKILYR
jgi:hypothetical protein